MASFGVRHAELVAEGKIHYHGVAYSPLGRGMLTSAIRGREDLATDDSRHDNPRFSEVNFAHNLRLVGQVEAVAREVGATPAQVALGCAVRGCVQSGAVTASAALWVAAQLARSLRASSSGVPASALKATRARPGSAGRSMTS